MGVRLYLNTEDISIIERVLGVPAGSFDKYAEIVARHQVELSSKAGLGAFDLQDFEFEQHQELVNDEIMNPVYNYNVFGFHKLTQECRIIMLAKGLDIECGSTTDMELADMLLAFQGVDLHDVPIEETGGVCWC